jgi:hypothetical protein
MAKVDDQSFWTDDADAVDAQLSRAMADGRLAEAARGAIERQKAKGMAMTFLRGDTVVMQHADGREDILGTIARRPHWTPQHTLIPKTP